MTSYFITATDTDAGKTYVACALIRALVQSSNKVAVYKPISAGCELEDGVLVNEDAKLLSLEANCQQTTSNINPIAFAEPIAPHIAANKTQQYISLSQIGENFKQVQNLKADINIVEGAGGWRLPIGNGDYLSDFVKQAKLKVILVVNMKLGCLNHAVLTYESIINDGLNCIAWVANCPAQMPYLADNINELKSLLPIPQLAILPNTSDLDIAASQFNLSVL
ncbi:MAG: dethiobiotin synthase [Colwellia sp.]|nr:dethiobiotin synthase [Colwellia sp.]